MTPDEMVALIDAAPPGPWPDGWRAWPNVCEAHRIMFRREADRIRKLAEPGVEWPRSRGIVTCGGGLKYFPGVWVLAHVLRDLGCTLPIQVWHLGSLEMDPGMARLLEPLGVECIDAFKVAEKYPARILCGFEIKIFAALYAPFEEILFLDADNLPSRDPSDVFTWDQYLRHGAIFWPDYACWKLKPDVWRIWAMEDILEDVIDDTAFESGQYVIDKRRCWRELMLAKWLADHSDYTFGTVYGDKECFHLAWRRLGKDYAMPRYVPGWAGDCCIVQHDFSGKPIFFHRCGDKWRLDGRNRFAGLPYEERAAGLLRELRQRWNGVPWNNIDPTPQERQVISELTGARFMYRRVGYDERPMRLEANGKVGEGAAECERRWDVHIVGDQTILTLSRLDRPTCHLVRQSDGTWHGRWLEFERMPVVMEPILEPTASASPREGETSPDAKSSASQGVEEDEETDLAAAVTVVVVSFRRFACLAELLRSIRAHYPDLRVIVADQSGPDAQTDEQAQWCRQHPQVQWLELPYDCGLSAARNAAIAQVRTPYVWLMDDDFLVLPCTDAMSALRLLREISRAELVAGPLYDLATMHISDWAATLTVEPGPPPVVRSSAPGPWRKSKHGPLWRPVSRFLNSFIAKTEMLRRVPWRNELKIRGEHRVHMADLVRHGVHCIETPALTLAHQAQRRGDADYMQMRSRHYWYETPLYRFAGEWSAYEHPVPQPALTHPCRGIVVLTPGHTGSRVVGRLFDALGWRMPEMDVVFGESADVRAINQRLLRGERLRPEELRAQVAAWPRPWCIKDPRLCETLDAWLPALTDDAPLLVVVERDLDATRESWRRRGESLEILERRLKRVEHHWAYWPWERRRVQFDAVCAAWQRLPEPASGEAHDQSLWGPVANDPSPAVVHVSENDDAARDANR